MTMFPRLRIDWGFVLLAAAYLAVRLSILLSAPHALLESEEFYNGTSAKEMLRGLKLPLAEYQYFLHEGGSLVMSILCVPFFAVLGTNFVSMKLPALAVSFATFVIWYVFAKRFVNRSVARYLGVLFVLAPPLIVKTDLMLWGHHNSINLLIALAAYFLFCILHAGKGTQHTRSVAALGVTCGFGLFFAYSFLVMLVACLVRLCCEKSFRRHEFRRFAIFFGIGFSPWLGLRLCYGSVDPGLVDRFTGWEFAIGDSLDFVCRLFLASPCLPGVAALPKLDLSYAYSGLLVTGVLFSLFRATREDRKKLVSLLTKTAAKADVEVDSGTRASESFNQTGDPNSRSDQASRDAARFAGLYCLLFVTIFATSPYAAGPILSRLVGWVKYYRHLLPLYPFLFLLAAIALSEGRRKWWRTVPRLMGGLTMCCLGCYGIVQTVQWSDMGRSFAFSGYSYEKFGSRMFVKYLYNPSRAIEIGRRIDRQFRKDYYRGIGWYFDDQPLPVLIDFGVFALWENAIPDEYLPLLYEGLGFAIVKHANLDVDQINRFSSHIEQRHRPSLYRGVGWRVAALYRDDLNHAMRFIEKLPLKYRNEAYVGFGRVVGTLGLFGKYVPDDFRGLPQQFQDSIGEGRRFAERLYASGRLNFCDYIVSNSYLDL